MSGSKRVCFGVPTVFSFSSKTCSVCPDFGHCRRLAYDELKQVDTPATRELLIAHERFAEMPVVMVKPEIKPTPAAPVQARVSRAKYRQFELTDQQKGIIESVPVKVGDFLTKLFRRGHDVEIRMALRDGKKPLEDASGYRSLKVALRHLKKGFDRQTLRTCFMEELGWSYNSAWNEVSIMWAALPAMGVAMEKMGKMVVAPSVKAKND